MKIKSIVTAIAMAGAFGAIAEAATQAGQWPDAALKLQPVTNLKTIKPNVVKSKSSAGKNKGAQKAYFKENHHEGKKRYIVRLVDDATASYKGDIHGLDATNISAKKSGLANAEFDPKSVASTKYVAYLEQKQNTFLQDVSSKLGTNIPDLRRFKYALNGLLTELTLAEAQKIADMPHVAFVQQEQIHQLNTDTGPILIGAGEVWDGTAGGSEYRGEGTIIGILDTGINSDHRSFAATGDDGYTVVNPLGDGTYLGDCVADASLCNSKLIGIYSYSEITDVYADPIFASDTRPANGEDYDGHGSHTASTAGGNTLVNVPYMVNDVNQGTAGDGIATSYVFTSMSGVAPHANIIAYQVCLPGSNGDKYSGCVGGPIIASIDQAIADGVDVINYSIGRAGGPGRNFSPWTDATELAFLNAQAAGIFVATSAGNEGPDASTTTKVSPWYTSAAAANHGMARVSGDGKTVGTFTGGDTTPPADISGGGINDGFTGDIVYAGDFTNSNDPTGDPAQCLQPFPAATFTATQIVVCDRGAIARVAKGANAAAGGAGGFVLANIQGGSDTIADDYYAVPGIHINAADGDALKAWIASGTGHQATISGATLSRGTNTADQIAGFSSRGPNEFGEIITPQIAAPGVNIYAAYSDEQPFKDVTGGFPVDYSFLNGTSMASPHVAGTAALMKQAHPTWNPDQIRSALMMTSQAAMLKEDGVTAADFWDMGAGRVQVNLAVNAGLVLSETQANYVAANPAAGGDPKTLNTPSMANFACGNQCSWTRTFTAVRDGTYTIATDDTALVAEPASFTVVAGDTQSVTFTMSVTGLENGTEKFGTATITATDQPDLHLPVYVQVNNGGVPDSANIVAGRNDGSYTVTGVQSFATSELTFTLDGLFDANATGFSASEAFDIPVDTTNNDYADDLTQVFVFEFEVPANAVSLNVSIADATSPDNDLFVERSIDGTYTNISGFDGATGATNESLTFAAPEPGMYRAIVQNFASTNASDTGTLNVSVVPQTDPVPGLTIEAPTSTNGVSPIDVKLIWDLAMVPGDSYTGDITVAAGDVVIGTFPVTLDRVADDMTAVSTATTAARGDAIEYTLTVNPSVYNQDQNYDISVDMPANMSLVEGSVVSTGGNVTVKNPNAVGLNIVENFDIPVDPTNGDYRDDLSQVFVHEFDVPSGSLSLTATISDSTSPDNDLFIEFDSAGDGTYATRVAFAASGATNETATAAAPAEGMYRVIVQNWAGSSAASDTGTVTITTVPATGEGFIWNLEALAPVPSYTVVSSVDDASCAAAGFGGYLDLAASGITTQGISGDETTWSAFAGSTFPFYGNDRQGLSFNANGFLLFSGGAGANAWNNLPIPNAAAPNDMLAAWWKDQIVEDDGVRGIRLASIGSVGLAIVSFDGLESWTADGSSTDRFSYQAIAFDNISDDHSGFGPYELIVAYSADQVGSFTGATAGVENANGSAGVDASAMIQAGTQLCYDAIQFAQGYEVTFSVVPQAGYLGQTAAPQVTVDTDMTGADTLTVAATEVELVNVAPLANAGADTTYDRADAPSQIQLNASRTQDNDEDRLSFKWSQVSGTDVDLSGVGSIHAFFNLKDAPNGTYTFKVDVTDGEFSSSDDVSITIEGEEQGGGSTGLLLLLGLPLLFRRRSSKK